MMLSLNPAQFHSLEQDSQQQLVSKIWCAKPFWLGTRMLKSLAKLSSICVKELYSFKSHDRIIITSLALV